MDSIVKFLTAKSKPKSQAKSKSKPRVGNQSWNWKSEIENEFEFLNGRSLQESWTFPERFWTKKCFGRKNVLGVKSYKLRWWQSSIEGSNQRSIERLYHLGFQNVGAMWAMSARCAMCATRAIGEPCALWVGWASWASWAPWASWAWGFVNCNGILVIHCVSIFVLCFIYVNADYGMLLTLPLERNE